MGTVRHTESVLEAIKTIGIRANIGKCLMDHPIYTPVGLREDAKAALLEARTLFQKWNGQANDRIRVSYAPRFVIACTENLLKEVARQAALDHAIIHTHASENLKEIELVRKLYGCENLEVLEKLGLTSERLVLAHCVWLNPLEKQILQKSGTHVVHCPSSNLKLASGFAPIPELMSKKINVALGADGAPCNNNLNMFHEMRLAALIHKPGAGPRSMRAMDVLDMATLHGAKALQWDQQIGSIEVGKKADLIALDLNSPFNSIPHTHALNPETIASSIVYSSDKQNIHWTMVDGKVVALHGKVKNLPLQSLMKKMRQAQTQFEAIA